mgnify:CR=1 FL=1
MTTREFYVAVSTLEGIPSELTDKAFDLIDAMDKRNEKRKSADSKAKKETSSRRDAVLAFLSENEGVHSRDEIASGCEITEGQATSACTALVKEGLVAKSTIKVDKAKKVVYSIATADSEDESEE